MLPEDLVKAGFTHSCYPNYGLSPKNEYVAISAKRPGEQKTLDFSTLFLGGDELMKCQCGFNGCRGSIRGFDHLPAIFQEKYVEMGIAPVIKELNGKR
jgi:hypothetical protein